jgi:hypothetical protein
MDRPDIGKPAVGPGKQFRLVARTPSIEEANRIAEQYELQGYETQIVKKSQATLAVYEVWVSKEPEIFSGNQRT